MLQCVHVKDSQLELKGVSFLCPHYTDCRKYMKCSEKRGGEKPVGRYCVKLCNAKQCIGSATAGVLRCQWWDLWLKNSEFVNFEDHCWRWRWTFSRLEALVFAKVLLSSRCHFEAHCDAVPWRTLRELPVSLTDVAEWGELTLAERTSLVPTSQQTSRNGITSTVPGRSVIFFCRNHSLMATPTLT